MRGGEIHVVSLVGVDLPSLEPGVAMMRWTAQRSDEHFSTSIKNVLENVIENYVNNRKIMLEDEVLWVRMQESPGVSIELLNIKLKSFKKTLMS